MTDSGPFHHAHGAVATDEGVSLAVAKRVFGEDPKPIIACPPQPWRRREELNEVLVA